MSDQGVARVGERTEEQHAAVRRRALPVAACGVICALGGIGLTQFIPVTAFSPPNFFGMNLSFCAMLMGVGIFFYAKPTPGTGAAQAISAAALVLGMAGTVLYAYRAINQRVIKEKLELVNVTAIAQAAGAHAKEHGGAYPADLLVLLEENRIKPSHLQSPWATNSPLFNDFEATKRLAGTRDKLLDTVEGAADYLYVGGDLRDVPADAAKDIFVSVSNTTIMRVSLAIAFADGSARFIRAREVPEVMKACNDARAKIGLPPVKPPDVMRKVEDEGARDPRR